MFLLVDLVLAKEFFVAFPNAAHEKFDFSVGKVITSSSAADAHLSLVLLPVIICLYVSDDMMMGIN